MDTNYPVGGVIAEQTLETDYQLLAGVVDLPNPRHTFEENKIQYNQNDIGITTCTLHGSMTAFSALTGYKFTDDQRKFLLAEAMKDGFDPAIGWYVNKGVALIAKWGSVWLKEEITYYRVELDSQEHEDNAKRGYMFVVGYNGNGAYNIDHYGDNRLDGVSFGKPTYGHCISEGNHSDTDGQFVDNYWTVDATGNVYLVNKANFAPLVANGVFFRDAYVFAYKQDVQHPPSLISSFAVNSVEKAKKHGILDWSNPQQLVDSVLLEDILKKLGLLTVDTDKGVSKERLIVALDRAKLLD